MERKKRLDAEAKSQLASLQQNKPVPADMSTYLESIQSMHTKYEEEKQLVGKIIDEEDKDPNARAMNQSKKAFAKELKKVIEASDVIIEVLDARDPEGCRSLELEREILTQGKKVLLVVNKIDLVPPQNARMW